MDVSRESFKLKGHFEYDYTYLKVIYNSPTNMNVTVPDRDYFLSVRCVLESIWTYSNRIQYYIITNGTVYTHNTIKSMYMYTYQDNIVEHKVQDRVHDEM